MCNKKKIDNCSSNSTTLSNSTDTILPGCPTSDGKMSAGTLLSSQLLENWGRVRDKSF